MPIMTVNDYRKTVNSYLREFGTDPNDVPTEIVWNMMGDDIGPATAARIIHDAAKEVEAEQGGPLLN